MPWLLAIAGWLYAARKADARETRKELRSDASEVAGLIEQINGELKGYLCQEFSDIERAVARVAILSALQALLAKTEHLTKDLRSGSHDVNAQVCTTRLHSYYELASNDYLESTIKLSTSDAELHYFNLRSEGLLLKTSIDALFRARFPAKR